LLSFEKKSFPASHSFFKEQKMKIGYARISTHDQSVDLQRDALAAAGCEKIFQDTASGAKSERAGLAEAVEFARAGDTLVVWKLDRLGRSLKHLIETINQLHEKGVGFASLQENIDTTTSGGKLIFHVFGALAEFERELIRERTQAGLRAARARGRKGGRKEKLSPKQVEMAKAMVADPNISISAICETLKISKPTLYRYVPAPGKIRKEETQEQRKLL
jgi:DNA invertase Pin-like site-specific DNA recombinase